MYMNPAEQAFLVHIAGCRVDRWRQRSPYVYPARVPINIKCKAPQSKNGTPVRAQVIEIWPNYTRMRLTPRFRRPIPELANVDNRAVSIYFTNILPCALHRTLMVK